MESADHIVAALVDDPTTESLLDSLAPEVQESLKLHWGLVIERELEALFPPAAPTPVASAPPAAATAPVVIEAPAPQAAVTTDAPAQPAAEEAAPGVQSEPPAAPAPTEPRS